jgi:hypothetical protein
VPWPRADQGSGGLTAHLNPMNCPATTSPQQRPGTAPDNFRSVRREVACAK